MKTNPEDLNAAALNYRETPDNDGFDALWMLVAPLCQSSASRYFQCRADDPRVEEAVSLVSGVLAEQRLASWDPARPFRPWILTVVRKRCGQVTDDLTRARKNCVSLLGGEDGDEALLEPMVESLSKGASAPLKAADNVRLLEAALLTLSESDLTLVRTWLVVAAEKPGFHGIDAEVARRLGLEPYQVSRKMAELRQLLFGALGGPDAYFSN